jgi:GDPmannose 4,6-dehydratase
MKKAFITGILGQDGAYLSKLLLKKGYKISGISRDVCNESRQNLKYLKIIDDVELISCDVLDKSKLKEIILDRQPCEIYNLAAQSSVGKSFSVPDLTFEINTLSVLNILEIMRNKLPDTRLFHASSGEIFGAAKELPTKENSQYSPLSPYAVSKLAAHTLVKNYRESFNLFACNGILYPHESVLRDETFFIKKVINHSIKIANDKQNELRVGNIDVIRDLGYAPDYAEAMWLMLQQDKPDDYNICSGKALSLKEITYHVFEKLNINKNKLIIDKELYRPADIDILCGDNSKAKEKLQWKYDKDFFEVLDLLIQSSLQELNKLK